MARLKPADLPDSPRGLKLELAAAYVGLAGRLRHLAAPVGQTLWLGPPFNLAAPVRRGGLSFVPASFIMSPVRLLLIIGLICIAALVSSALLAR